MLNLCRKTSGTVFHINLWKIYLQCNAQGTQIHRNSAVKCVFSECISATSALNHLAINGYYWCMHSSGHLHCFKTLDAKNAFGHIPERMRMARFAVLSHESQIFIPILDI